MMKVDLALCTESAFKQFAYLVLYVVLFLCLVLYKDVRC